jgi:hypothetical protein
MHDLMLVRLAAIDEQQLLACVELAFQGVAVDFQGWVRTHAESSSRIRKEERGRGAIVADRGPAWAQEETPLGMAAAGPEGF